MHNFFSQIPEHYDNCLFLKNIFILSQRIVNSPKLTLAQWTKFWPKTVRMPGLISRIWTRIIIDIYYYYYYYWIILNFTKKERGTHATRRQRRRSNQRSSFTVNNIIIHILHVMYVWWWWWCSRETAQHDQILVLMFAICRRRCAAAQEIWHILQKAVLCLFLLFQVFAHIIFKNIYIGNAKHFLILISFYI